MGINHNLVTSVVAYLKILCLDQFYSYLLYTAPLADLFRQHKLQFHLYADYTQLYVSFSTNNDLELTEAVERIELCLTDLDTWMRIKDLPEHIKNSDNLETFKTRLKTYLLKEIFVYIYFFVYGLISNFNFL